MASKKIQNAPVGVEVWKYDGNEYTDKERFQLAAGYFPSDCDLSWNDRHKPEEWALESFALEYKICDKSPYQLIKAVSSRGRSTPVGFQILGTFVPMPGLE